MRKERRKAVQRAHRITILWGFVLAIIIALLVVVFGAGPKAAEAHHAPERVHAFNIGKQYLGVNYKLGGHRAAHNWKRYGGLDCSGLTMLAYERATKGRIHLSDSLGSLWNQTRWRKNRHGRRGDIVFYKEGTSHLTHVGIYAGKNRNGTPMVLHASSYWGEVTLKPMRWRGDGFVGIRAVKGVRR